MLIDSPEFEKQYLQLTFQITFCKTAAERSLREGRLDLVGHYLASLIAVTDQLEDHFTDFGGSLFDMFPDHRAMLSARFPTIYFDPEALDEAEIERAKGGACR